jgi:uncharacterized membrane protein YdjX (TVP38/TMEM64 family)
VDPDDRNGAPAAQAIASAIVALGFLALLALIFWRATEAGQDFDRIWGATGTIIGVVVGAIPSFFFQRQLMSERSRSALLADRNMTLAGTSEPEAVKRALDMVPRPTK